jgi:glutamate synthase domain-containing protein 3
MISLKKYQLLQYGQRKYMFKILRQQLMADALDIVERSFSINSKLSSRLEAAAEQNAILRIGWTNSGDPVPKNGELGLCPGLPVGSKLRALGVLGSWIAPFGKGGSFTIQGDSGSFLGAGNDGNTIICERSSGNYTGFAMKSGKITILDGSGNDSGACMTGGVLVIRGNSGSRIGGGMSGGLIVIDGDVGNDPGAGMTGGRIVINGRCPNPPEGVSLRPLTESEQKEINKQLDDKAHEIPKDAICLEANEDTYEQTREYLVSSGDLSGIGLVPGDDHRKMKYVTCDTVSLIGERGDENTPIALPLPVMPFIEDASHLKLAKEESAELIESLNKQPFMTRSNPRNIDFLVVDQNNLSEVADMAAEAGGVIIDFTSMPSMNSEEIDGILVAIRSFMGRNKPYALMEGIGRIDTLHVRSSYHGADIAISKIEDGTGISEPASLPLIGRSSKANLDDTHTESGIMLGFSVDAQDLAILSATGIKVVCCEVPMIEPIDLAIWINGLGKDLSNILRELGLDSIDGLNRQHLRALNYETAAVSGLRLAGYERPLPHWFAR